MYSKKKMLGTEIAVHTIGDRRSPPSAEWGAVPLKEITIQKRAFTRPSVVTISPIVWRDRCFICGESYEREIGEEDCCCGRCCRSCVANLAEY